MLNPTADLLHHPRHGSDRPCASVLIATFTTMSAYKSDFLQTLADRGFIHQVSEPDALDDGLTDPFAADFRHLLELAAPDRR